MNAEADFAEALDAFQRGSFERARELAELGLAAAPSPKWRHLLGLAHCRAGNPSAGLDHLRAAAEAEPGNAGFQLMLMRALVDAGRPRDVLAMAEPPPIASPADMALWEARAEAADAAGDSEAAAAARERLTGVLVEAGRGLQSQLRFDEAEEAFRRAHALNPMNVDVVRELGLALERTNKLDALARLLKEVEKAGIATERLPYLRAVLARRQDRLEEAHDLLLRADPEEDPVRWHALRAKIADALGSSAEAFEAATAMNRAAIANTSGAKDPEAWKRKTGAYREEQHALARTITRDWAARVPLLTEPCSKRVSFLIGFPRSGTTLLDTFLLGHPQVKVLEERQLVGRAAAAVGPTERLPRSSLPKLRKARSAYLAMLADEVGRDFDGLTVDKFPLDMASAPLIQAIFPGAPFIFALRHPCDVVLSGFMQPFGVVNFADIADAADYYDAMMSIWTASREAMQLNVHTVVYEELVRDPEAVLRPLLDFLGLDWDARVLDHERTAKARGTIVTPSYDQVTEPITTRAAGRWKRYEKQLEPVLPILLPWAKRLGYRE